ncbi:MAG TPA: hypothetical protein VHF26_05645 [Trebonia sp.]|nr:hypothetical protein [Trebonia sp.]
MTTPHEPSGRDPGTAIVHIRLSGQREDLTRLAAAITALPGLTVTAMSLRRSRKDPGMRGYLTVVMPQPAEKENRDAEPDA